jgi:hypothetical protein
MLPRVRSQSLATLGFDKNACGVQEMANSTLSQDALVEPHDSERLSGKSWHKRPRLCIVLKNEQARTLAPRKMHFSDSLWALI